MDNRHKFGLREINADAYLTIPEHMREGIRSYIEDRTPPGGFLCAVLENNLAESLGRADHINRERLYDIVKFLWNKAPAVCWGSPEKVDMWVKSGIEQPQKEQLWFIHEESEGAKSSD